MTTIYIILYAEMSNPNTSPHLLYGVDHRLDVQYIFSMFSRDGEIYGRTPGPRQRALEGK